MRTTLLSLLKIFIILCFYAVSTIATVSQDNIVVFVSKNSPLVSISIQDVQYIYSGKLTILKNGIKPIPLDIGNNTVLRQEFYGRLLNVSMEKFDAIWARLLFTGHATPPRLLQSEQEELETVNSNNQALGFAFQHEVDTKKFQIVTEFH